MAKRSLTPTCALAAFVLAVPATALSAEQPRIVTDGDVTAVARSGNRLFVGGNFSRTYEPFGAGLIVDGRTGRDSVAKPAVDGLRITAAIGDGAGGFFAAVDSRRVIHLLADGSRDPAFSVVANDEARPVGTGGGFVFLDGDFSRVNGEDRDGFAVVSAATGALAPVVVSPNGSVRAVAVSGSTAYLGGTFSRVGAAPRTGLAAINLTTGALLPWAPRVVTDPGAGPLSGVQALLIDATRGQLVVGGGFGSIDGVARGGLASVDLATGQLTSWAPRLDPVETVGPPEEPGDPEVVTRDRSVTTLATANGLIFAGGTFTVPVGTTTRDGLAAFDLATAAPTPWTPQVPAPGRNQRHIIAAGTDLLYVGYPTPAATGLADGTLAAWSPAIRLKPRAFALSSAPGAAAVDTRLLIGGFGAIGTGRPRSDLAVIDLRTGRQLPIAGIDGGSVYGLAASRTTLYLSGLFNRVGRRSRDGLAAIDIRTGRVTGWQPRLAEGGYVDALAIGPRGVSFVERSVNDSALYSGVLRQVDTTTGRRERWRRTVRDVEQIAAAGDRVYLLGTFTRVAGKPRRGLAALDARTGRLTGWAPRGPADTRSLQSIAATRGAVAVSWTVSTTVRGRTHTDRVMTTFDPRNGRRTTPIVPIAAAPVAIIGRTWIGIDNDTNGDVPSIVFQSPLATR